MLFQKDKVNGRSISFGFGILAVAFAGAVALGSNNLVQDRRVSLAQAKQMVKQAQSNSAFPIVVNERVLKQLNNFLGTPDGRQFMKDSILRMQRYKSILEENFSKHGVPEELAAVGLVESGYQNLSQTPHNQSAGVWQFIPQTARNFGLRVTAALDERLDERLLTDAAMRYLLSNYLRFKDWQLSILAYNAGENAVQEGIDVTKSRDVWTLIQNGFEGDKNYVAKVMAAVLILKNPEVLE